MRVFKPTVPSGNGKKKTPRWYVSVQDPEGRWRSVRGFTDKRMTEDLGRRIEALVARRVNRESPDATLAAWIEGLTPYLRKRLDAIGALDRRRVAAGKRLTEHLDDFRQALLAKGNTARHARLVAGRVHRIFEGCGFTHWSDIGAAKVSAYLADLRRDEVDATGKAKKRGISAQTSNFYLQAAKQFCRWMVRERRASESPLAHLQGLNVKTDRRHDRRALTVEEMNRLLATTTREPERYGMSGSERAMLYRLAVETGLRAAELASLSRVSFDLAGPRPTVTVQAAYSKHRREDVLPLRPEMAALLRAHLARKLPAVPAFGMPGKRGDTAKMLKRDLNAAGIPYRDDSGRVADFHALRHTFITNLAASGVHPKTAQALARHSTINLTMDRYTHTLMGEQRAALEALPDLSPESDEAARKTGTDDAAADEKSLAPRLRQRTDFGASPKTSVFACA